MGKIRMKKPAEAITLESAFKEFTVSKAATVFDDERGAHMKTLQMLYKMVTPLDYIEKDGEYTKLLKKAVSEEAKYWQELSEDGRKAYDQYGDIISEMDEILKCDAFAQRFCLGVRIILEVLGEYRIGEPDIAKTVDL